jgi:hypothetical protein
MNKDKQLQQQPSPNQQEQQKQQQQQKRIEELQQTVIDQQSQLEQKDQKIEYLRQVQQEYQELRQAFGGNGNLTYYDAMNTILTRRNRELDQQRNMINMQLNAEYEARKAEEQQALEQHILKENAVWQENYNERKAKIEQARDNILKIAEEFYLLDESKLRKYTDINHELEESAVKHLIDEYYDIDELGKKRFAYYECNYCHEQKTSLSAFERHCFYEGDSHHDVNTSRIRNEASNLKAKATKEFKQDIAQAIKAKKDQEYRKQKQAERAAETRAKQSQPYVPRQ